MSYGTLLSSAGTQALQSMQSNNDAMYYLGTVNTDNSYTGQSAKFNNQSIFTNSSGISSEYTSGGYNNFGQVDYNSYTNPAYRGRDGLNRRGAISGYDTRRSAIPTNEGQYANALYGSSLMGNYMVSIQNVALGQYAPTSVFEQRLNYHLDYADQNKPGSMLGNYSNYCNVDSVANNQSSSSNYNTYSSSSSKTGNSFGSLTSSNAGLAKAAGANTVSDMMSIFGTVNTGSSTKLTQNTMKATGANTVSNLMSLMA